MSSVTKIFSVAGIAIILSVVAINASAQKNDAKAAAVKALVDSSQHYTFYATYVQPLTGTQRYLTSEYTLSVSKDTIISYLPFFGRAFSGVGYGTGDDGIKFTSTKFEYKSSPGRKGSWDISIKLKDAQNVQSVSMHISPGGNASVTVNSSNRDPVSYTGYVK